MSDLTQLYSDNNVNSIGDILRTRREELGLSLEEVSQRLRIRLIFLKALEEGRIDQLPGVAYASGFLRAYAELLKLDSDALVKRFRQANQANAEKPKLMFPAPVPQNGIPASVMIFFSILIMIGAYVGWYKMTDHHQPSSEMIPPAPVQADKNAASAQVSPQIASIMPTNHPADLPKNEAPIVSVPNASEALTSNQQQPVVSSGQPQSQPIEPVPAAPPVEPKQVVEQPLLIKAISPSWVQVKNQDGRVLYQKVLKTDETWQVPNDQDKVIMTVGNPGVIILQKGDVKSLPLGKKGRTLRHFVLDSGKAEKLLHPDVQVNQSTPKTLTPSEPTHSVKKKKVVPPRPKSVRQHDLSADDLNARQLSH